MATDGKSVTLTERRIRDARAGGKTYLLRDTKVIGLAVRVAAGGTKSFTLDYRANGTRRLATLARCSEMTLADARALAGRELAAVRNDGADPLQRRTDAREAPTVADLIDRFLDDYGPRRIDRGRLAPKTLREYRKQANNTLRPALGRIKVADVTRADIERAVDGCAPYSRNRHIALAHRLFNLAEDWEMRPTGGNPARRIDKAREEPRDRVLAPSELAALGAALSGLDNPIVAAALRFLVLTGWRNSEALALRWENVDMEMGEALLPSTKVGRDRRSIGAAALAIVADLPRINDNPHCFAGAKAAAVSYKTLHKAFKRACEGAGIEDARLHDLRRTLATSAASTMTLTGLRDLLGHRTTTMAARYARRSDSVLRQHQDDMAARMAATLAGRDAEIVDLNRAG